MISEQPNRVILTEPNSYQTDSQFFFRRPNQNRTEKISIPHITTGGHKEVEDKEVLSRIAREEDWHNFLKYMSVIVSVIVCISVQAIYKTSSSVFQLNHLGLWLGPPMQNISRP